MSNIKKPRRMARPPVDGSNADSDPGAIDASGANLAAPAEPRVTKQSLILDLLQQGEGASLAEIVEATGWLPHTARAALTGLRKKGHLIDRGKVGDMTRYTIVPVAVSSPSPALRPAMGGVALGLVNWRLSLAWPRTSSPPSLRDGSRQP